MDCWEPMPHFPKVVRLHECWQTLAGFQSRSLRPFSFFRVIHGLPG
jgi:hypothetical protein